MGFVSLKVYDILGTEITTLINEEKPAGNYEVEFDATELSSGTYFYKLISGNFVSVKKMLLMK
ncbi:MAG TPA: T9SS type A sorting domain-containing protein [Ignavibacteriaceae bacterium]|nr:T9SS type A sorting domain-containing protein [Ignavibacteriaceae bacterium]